MGPRTSLTWPTSSRAADLSGSPVISLTVYAAPELGIAGADMASAGGPGTGDQPRFRYSARLAVMIGVDPQQGLAYGGGDQRV
jgi:hypothetical protein